MTLPYILSGILPYHSKENKPPCRAACGIQEILNFLALGGDLHQALGDELVGSHSAQVLTLTGTDGNGAVLHVAVADDQHVGDLLHLSLTDLVAQLLGAAVGLSLSK